MNKKANTSYIKDTFHSFGGRDKHKFINPSMHCGEDENIELHENYVSHQSNQITSNLMCHIS